MSTKKLTVKEAKQKLNRVLNLTLAELEALSLEELKELDEALNVALTSKLKKADREDFETFKETLADITSRKILEAVANDKKATKADKKATKADKKKKAEAKIEESLEEFRSVKIGDKFKIYVKDSSEYEPAYCVAKLVDERSLILVDEDLFKYEITFERFHKKEWIKYIDGKREILVLEKIDN